MIHPPTEPNAARAALATALPTSSEPAANAPRRRLARQTLSADPAAAEQRYINREQLRELIPASDMTLHRWINNPRIAFPAPDKLGDGHRNYWWLPKIHSWMRDRQKQQTQRPAGERHGAKGGTA